MSDSALRALADDPSSRKRFFKMMGGAGAVSAFSIFLAACGDDDEDEGGTAQTQPETDTTLVPVEVSVPMRANSSPPMRTMCGTFISVSTLLMSVGPW